MWWTWGRAACPSWTLMAGSVPTESWAVKRCDLSLSSICLCQSTEYFPSQHFPKCLQRGSLPRDQQDGVPHGGFFYGRPLGFSNPKRNFYASFSGSRVRGVFCGGGDDLVMIWCLVSSFKKIPNKPGNSHHGVFGILLKNRKPRNTKFKLQLSETYIFPSGSVKLN